MESLTTVIIPFDDRVFFVRLLNCAEFSSRLSEVVQFLHAISRIQFLVGGRWLSERCFLARSESGGRSGMTGAVEELYAGWVSPY